MIPAAFDKTVAVTKLSIAAPCIEILADTGEVLATASAAFYLGDDGDYIVTNWHNLAGVNPLTGVPLSSSRRYPASVRIIGRHMYDDVWNVPITFEISIRHGHDGRYNWKQHPLFVNKVDVAAIRIPDNIKLKLVHANSDIWTSPVIKGPRDEIFVLGYPLNISGGVNYPLWKRASIASEPSEDINGLPKYLIDTASRKGMSGAPFFYRSHVHLTNDDKLSVGQTAQIFYGIYSGRLVELGDSVADPIAAQIGTVWKPAAVAEVVNHGTSPTL
ncbi:MULTISPECIES: hypothetical protein [unclassified Sphingomonas]|uniref:hypothetical protein n=1 Tax=unclassified Sphingomonas TaxID=196159 RepID=UPI000AF3F659|nr:MULTISPECIES: hypothetical protein [unclassified Sphingomonas]